MHEVRATVPAEHIAEAIRLAKAVGIDEATTSDVFVHGPDVRRVLLSVETSTPKARDFTDALMKSGFFSSELTLTSREVRAIICKTPVESLTRPMSEPFPDLIQDLWQLSHVTWSYLARALAGGIILATG